MTIEIVISSAVVAAIITVIGNVIAAKINQKTTVKTAREAASNELVKMQATWNREDLVSSDEEFAEMANAVARFVYIDSSQRKSDALGKVASVRAKEVGDIGLTLDDLYEYIRESNKEAANNTLKVAIDQRRQMRCRQ